MKHKEILLWVVSLAALLFSILALVQPKGLRSDAAMIGVGQYQTVAQPGIRTNGVTVGTPWSNGTAHDNVCAELAEERQQAWNEYYEAYGEGDYDNAKISQTQAYAAEDAMAEEGCGVPDSGAGDESAKK